MNRQYSRAGTYVEDAEYTSSFVPDQAPILLSYVAATAGFAAPDPGRAFRYLELGCSSGVTLNLLAAACPQARFTGIDINPAHIDNARHAAAVAGLSNVDYIVGAFSGLNPSTLPKFDYITCQGTYSWLDRAEKSALLQILNACMAADGILLLGYVTFGRISITPMWHVMRKLVPDHDSASTRRMGRGLQLLAELRDAGARYLDAHPQALQTLNDSAAGGKSDAELSNLAHNALAENYTVSFFDEVAEELTAIGLNFCGQSSPFLNDPDLCVPVDVRQRFDTLETTAQQELFKDFVRLSVTRQDVFIRQPRATGDAGEASRPDRVGATLFAQPEQAWNQLLQADWASFDYARPIIRFVFDLIAAGETNLDEIIEMSDYDPLALADAWRKLIASPSVGLCLPDASSAGADTPRTVSVASGYNRKALEAAADSMRTALVAAPGMGSGMQLNFPSAVVTLDYCDHELGTPDDEAFRRVTAHLSESDRKREPALADPAVFAEFRRWYRTNLLPALLRFGVLDHE